MDDDGVYITERIPSARRFTAREAVVCVVLAGFLLLLFKGPSIKTEGEKLDEGLIRDVVVNVGKPISSVTKPLPFDNWSDDLFGWLSPDDDLSGTGGFETPASAVGPSRAAGPGVVTPQSFDAVSLGQSGKKAELGKLLVTGDSLSVPLDTQLARELADEGVQTKRDPHVGTGLSQNDIVDWGRLSALQTSKEKPDAVVYFLGANEGFPMKGPDGKNVNCCGPAWAAVYANRARRLMSNYLTRPGTKVYWLLLPATRSGELTKVTKTVNAAVQVAAAPFLSRVRLIDLVPVFTPNNKFRNSMEVDGRERIVRESDGIHLTPAGTDVARDVVLEAMRKDFEGF